MIHFEWLALGLLLPLPLLLRYLIKPAEQNQAAALKVPALDAFGSTTELEYRANTHNKLLWLAYIAWGLLIIAAMRPQWLGDFVDIPISGRDLMLAVDLSYSMREEDFIINGSRVNRLIAVKSVAGQFIERRSGDRLGLILFADNAYLQAPLTFDTTTVKTLLTESQIGFAGQKTAIGDAIGLAIKRLRQQTGESRVLILLTDGVSNAGDVTPLAAADLAAREQLKIYTIGVGADEMIIPSLFGAQRINPAAELDEKTLMAVAEKTGGRYFRARDTQQLAKIYQILDQLEPIDKASQQFRPRKSLFYWPLGLALLLLIMLILKRYVR